MSKIAYIIIDSSVILSFVVMIGMTWDWGAACMGLACAIIGAALGISIARAIMKL